MTELLDSELQAAWDRNRKAPPHKRMSEAELFEKFKRKEPEKKGWLSHLASGYEAQADVAPKYAGFIRNAPAVAAGLATLPTYGLGTLENALRYRGGEGQQEQYPGVSPSASFHLGLGRDTGLTPEQFASGVQDFVPQPQDENFPILGGMGREEGSQVQEHIIKGWDFIDKRIFRPISRTIASVMPGDYLENVVDQLTYGALATLNPARFLGRTVTALKEGPNVMRDLAAGTKLSRRGELGPKTLNAMRNARDFMAGWGETDRVYSGLARRYANNKDLNDILATGEWNWYMGGVGKLMGLSTMPLEAISNLFKKGDPYYKYMEDEIGLSANALEAMEKLAIQVDKKRAQSTAEMSNEARVAHRSEINALARQLTQQPIYSFLLRRMYSPDHHSVQPGSQLHNYYKQLYHDEIVGKPGEIVSSDTFRQVTGMEHLKPEFLDEMVAMVSDAWGLQKQRFGRDLRIGGVREFKVSGNLMHTMQYDKARHYDHIRDVWQEVKQKAGDNWNGIAAEDFIKLLKGKGFYGKGLRVKDSSTPGHILVSYSTTTGNELLGGINVVSRINTKDGSTLMLGSDKLDILGPKANIAFGLGKNEDFLSVTFKDGSLAKGGENPGIAYNRKDWHRPDYADAQELISMADQARQKGGIPDIFEKDGYWYGGFRDRNGNRVTRSTGLRVDRPTKTRAREKVKEWAREASESFRKEATDIADIYPVSIDPPTSGRPAVLNPAFDPTGRSSSAFPYVPWSAWDASKAAGATKDLSLLGMGRSGALESLEQSIRNWTAARPEGAWSAGEVPASYGLRRRQLENMLSTIGYTGKVAAPGLLQEREF
jgi:hypothetical protein